MNNKYGYSTNENLHNFKDFRGVFFGKVILEIEIQHKIERFFSDFSFRIFLGAENYHKNGSLPALT